MIELQTVWGWQPALYLFLGGMGGGAFVFASILQLKYGDEASRTISASAWAALICLAVGLLCLITELTAPLRGLMLWQSFSNFSSWMCIGAWILVAAMVTLFLFALLSSEWAVKWLFGAWKTLPEKRNGMLKVLAILGIIFGLSVVVYTGVLLMSAPGVPLWNTALLPCLFTVSGVDTGIALVEIVAAICERKQPLSMDAKKFMARTVIVLVLVEAAVLALLLWMAISAGSESTGTADAANALSATLLVSGQLSVWFWVLVVVCGLVAPLVAALVQLPAFAKGREFRAALIGAVGALAGGCALRFLVVLAGLRADPVADAMSQVFADLLARL